MIKHLLDNNSNLNKLLTSIEDNKKISVLNCGEGEVIGILGEIGRPKLFVVSDEKELKYYYDKLTLLNKNVLTCTNIPNMFLNECTSSNTEYTFFLNNIYNTDYDVILITPNVLMLPIHSDFSTL